jgi:hypothetical protein
MTQISENCLAHNPNVGEPDSVPTMNPINSQVNLTTIREKQRWFLG